MYSLIQEYNNNFKEIFDNSFDYMYLHDLEGNILDINNVIIENLGYSREEIHIMKVTDFLSPDENIYEISEAIKNTIQTGVVSKPRIYRVKSKIGEIVYLEVNTIPLKKNGEVYAILGIGHDVSQYKKIEQELRASEKKYRHLFEQSPFSISIYDSKGILIASNQNLTHKLGDYAKEDFTGKGFIEIIKYFENSKQLIRLFSERFKSFRKGINLDPIEFPLITKEGRKIWLHWQSSKIKIGDENFIQVIMYDITDRKESEELFRILFEQAIDGILLANTKTMKFYTGNRMICDMLGYTLEEIKNLGVKDIHPEKNLPSILKQFERMVSGEISSTRDTPVKRKDGNIFYADINASMIEFAGRTYLMGIFRDISEYKIDRQKLIDSEEKFRLLFENANDGILLADTETWQIFTGNQKICDMLGYSLEELKNFGFADLHPKESLSYIDEQFESELREEIPMANDVPMKRKDGSIFYCSITSSEIELNDKTYFIGIFRDITTRRQAEEMIKSERDKLQAFIESVPIGITLSDPEGSFSEVNSAALDIFGYETKEEFYSEVSTKDLFHNPQDREKLLELQKKGPIINFEFLSKSKDGTLAWTLLNSVSHTIGNETAFFNSYLDITYRKKAEEILRESEEKFRNISEQSLMGIFILQDDVYKYVNKKYADMIGYPIDEVLTWPPLKFLENIHLDDLEKAMRIEEQVKLGTFEDIDGLQFRGVNKSGELFWSEVYAKNINYEGKNARLFNLVDITHQKEAERKLKESEEKFRTITEQSLIGILILQDDVIKYGNQRVVDILGYSIEEFKSWGPGEFIKTFHPDSRQLIIEQAEKKQRGASDVLNHYYAKFLNNTGETIWLEVFSKTIPYQGGLADFITFNDITERKKTEQELMESEKILKDFVHNATDSISIWDSNLNLIEMNKVAADPWNPAKEAEIGINMLEMAPSIKETERYEKYLVVIKTGEPVSFDNVRIPPNTGERYFNIKSFKVGNGIGIIGSEITERIRFEQELKESEEKFRTIAEQSFMGIVIAQEGKLEYLNKALAKIVGYPVEDMLNWTERDMAKMVHPDDVESILARLNSNREGTVSDFSHNAFKVINREGQIRWLEDYTSKIMYKGKIANLISLVDVTDKIEAEKLILEENRRLLELQELRRDLITRVSHELKTPMTSIYGSIQILLSIFKDRIDKDIMNYVEIGLRGCLRLNQLIENLLDTSRLESKKFELKLEKTNLGTLVSECVDDMMYLGNLRNISMRVNLPNEVYLTLDPLRFRQVLTNIISNAIKNTPRGGKVFINITEEKDHIDIDVRDTGVGLTITEKERLFEKFGKIERYGMDLDVDIEGVGIGLHIAKEITELHGGQILVQSEGRNKGATFTVRLFKKL